MQILSVLSHFQEHLSWPDNFESLMKTAVRLLLEYFDVQEIAVIRFDRDWKGSVVAKSENQDTGLHHSNWLTSNPLSIWQRDMLKQRMVNVQRGKPSTGARLILRSQEDLSAVSTVNMSNSLLQDVPLFDRACDDCIEFDSAVFISITAGGELWGVLSCLTYGGETDISFLDRKFCHQFAEVLSRNVDRLKGNQ